MRTSAQCTCGCEHLLLILMLTETKEENDIKISGEHGMNCIIVPVSVSGLGCWQQLKVRVRSEQRTAERSSSSGSWARDSDN